MAGETKGCDYFCKILSIFGIDRPDAVALEVKYETGCLSWVKVNGLTVLFSPANDLEFQERVTLLMNRLGVDDSNTVIFHLEASVESVMTYTTTGYVNKNKVGF